jgi:hypothetical protein
VIRSGEISPFGRYFLTLGAFFYEEYRPKFTLICSRFGLLFVLKIPKFDQIFRLAKVHIYYGSILGDIWTKLGTFFRQISGHTRSQRAVLSKVLTLQFVPTYFSLKTGLSKNCPQEQAFQIGRIFAPQLFLNSNVIPG